MKLLIITPECPYPPEKSGGVHTLFYLIKASSDSDIDLLYYGEKDSNAEVGLSKYVNSIVHIPSIRKSRFGHLASLLARVPYAQYRVSVPVDLHLREYDKVVLDQFSSLQFSEIVESRCLPTVLMHDSMPLFFSRKASQSHNLIDKIYYILQRRYSERVEALFARNCKKFVYVSEVDANEASNRLGKTIDCAAIPIGVEDYGEQRPLSIGRSVVFTGIMNYGPNEDASLYFANEVFPAIRERFPDVKLYLVGKDPTDTVKALASKDNGVVVTGYVDSVYRYILGSTVYVSPLRYGTGVKNKVLEALQCCKASVFSPISTDGIPEIEEGVNCLIATNTDDWIKKVSLLLGSEESRANLEKRLSEVPITHVRNWHNSFNALIGD